MLNLEIILRHIQGWPSILGSPLGDTVHCNNKSTAFILKSENPRWYTRRSDHADHADLVGCKSQLYPVIGIFSILPVLQELSENLHFYPDQGFSLLLFYPFWGAVWDSRTSLESVKGALKAYKTSGNISPNPEKS